MKLETSPAPTMEKLNSFLAEYASPSWFAVQSLEGFKSFSALADSGRIKKENYKHYEDDDLTCWRCNGKISHPSNEGMATTYKAGAKFNDHWACRGKHNTVKVMCGACEALADRAYHPNFKLNALYTGDNAYQLTLDEDLISFLIAPPPPPYLFVMAENNSQHMVWLSDYTFDSNMISVTKSRERYLVSREDALSLAKKYQDILILANEIRHLSGVDQPLTTPLKSSRREINNRTDNNMQLSESVNKAALAKENDDDSISQKKIELQALISDISDESFSFGLWYIGTMYLKALLNDLEVKPSADWQEMKQPK